MQNVCSDCTGAHGLHVHPCPEGSQREGKWSGFLGSFGDMVLQGPIRVPKGVPEGSQGVSKGPKGVQKGTQRVPKGIPRGPKGSQIVPKGSKMSPKVSQGGPKDAPRALKVSPKAYKRNSQTIQNVNKIDTQSVQQIVLKTLWLGGKT